MTKKRKRVGTVPRIVLWRLEHVDHGKQLGRQSAIAYVSEIRMTPYVAFGSKVKKSQRLKSIITFSEVETYVGEVSGNAAEVRFKRLLIDAGDAFTRAISTQG